MSADEAEFIRLHVIAWLVMLIIGLWAFVTGAISSTYVDESVLVDKMNERRYPTPLKRCLVSVLSGGLIILTGPFCGLVITYQYRQAKRYFEKQHNNERREKK
jgi:uncharacterized membrane protein